MQRVHFKDTKKSLSPFLLLWLPSGVGPRLCRWAMLLMRRWYCLVPPAPGQPAQGSPMRVRALLQSKPGGGCTAHIRLPEPGDPKIRGQRRCTGILDMASILQLAKYLGASIAGTLVHYVFLIALVRWFAVRPLWASTSGAVMGALVIYLINYFITFHSTKRHISASSRFIVVAAVCTAVNALILNTALTHMDWSLAPAQVFATGMQFSVGFAIHRVWTF